MAAKKFATCDILPLVDLEISMIGRYYKKASKANELSLIYFYIPSNYDYHEIFEKILRSTDAVIQENNHFVAILYGTNKTGASELLSGIQDFLNTRPLDLIVSYPEDGLDAKQIITKLQDEIKENYGVILECLKIEEPISLYDF